jgi:hypothetical protein
MFLFLSLCAVGKTPEQGAVATKEYTKKKLQKSGFHYAIFKNELSVFLNVVFALILNDASSISTNGAGIRYIGKCLSATHFAFIYRGIVELLWE